MQRPSSFACVHTPHRREPPYSQLIPASGSNRCRIAARQINTTSIEKVCQACFVDNLSMAQKQSAPTMQIIKTRLRPKAWKPLCGAVTISIASFRLCAAQSTPISRPFESKIKRPHRRAHFAVVSNDFTRW